MAFGTGAILTVWGVVNRGTYYEVDCSSSRKNRTTDRYETDFSSKFIQFCGKAANPPPRERDKIKLINCSVQNCYEKDGQRCYLKNPKYVVFEYELADANGGGMSGVAVPNANSYIPNAYGGNSVPSGFAEIPMDDSLPF